MGWNVEELENHRPDLPFERRYSAARERVAALRAAWAGTANEPSSFSVGWDRFVSVGRGPDDVPISLLCLTRPKPQRLAEHAELGLARIVQAAPTAEVQPEGDTRRLLDELTPIVAEWTPA